MGGGPGSAHTNRSLIMVVGSLAVAAVIVLLSQPLPDALPLTILFALLLAGLLQYRENAEGTPSVNNTIEFSRDIDATVGWIGQVSHVRLLELDIGDRERFRHPRTAVRRDRRNLMHHVGGGAVVEGLVRAAGGCQADGGRPASGGLGYPTTALPSNTTRPSSSVPSMNLSPGLRCSSWHPGSRWCGYRCHRHCSWNPTGRS